MKPISKSQAMISGSCLGVLSDSTLAAGSGLSLMDLGVTKGNSTGLPQGKF